MNALSRLPGLHVASRTSSFRFRGRESDIREIGRELDVAAVVEGSVRRAGSRLRVTAQLTNVADGYHLWSERYDREMADVFDIQDQIVASIVKAIAPTLAGDVKAAVKNDRPRTSKPTNSISKADTTGTSDRPRTYRRRFSASSRSSRSIPNTRWRTQGSPIASPSIVATPGISTGKSRPPALAAAARAMALDPSLAEVHYSQALVTYFFERHWRAAESHLRRALSINPRLAMAQAYLGLVLASDYRFDEALVEIDRAQDIDPLSPFIHFLAAAVLFMAGRFDALANSAAGDPGGAP
jgi:tetratricopeptide (TPR) repeat protein